MKSRVALFAAAMLASALALAQPDGPPRPDMDRMAVLLDLTDSQKAEVQKIFEEQREKLKAAREQYSSSGTKPTPEERARLREEMKQDLTTKLQGVLSPEQMKKFQALKDHPQRQRWRRKRDASL